MKGIGISLVHLQSLQINIKSLLGIAMIGAARHIAVPKVKVASSTRSSHKRKCPGLQLELYLDINLSLNIHNCESYPSVRPDFGRCLGRDPSACAL